MSNCPRCDQEIGKSLACDCGWRSRKRKSADSSRDFHSDPLIQCAHALCSIPAMCKVKTDTGWANLCPMHYERHFADSALKALDKYGMAKSHGETQAQHVARMRQFVLTTVKSMVAKKRENKRALDALVEDFATDTGLQP